MQQLIAAAETAARARADGFGEYARSALGQIGRLISQLAAGSSEEDWKRLYTIVHDLRASSATVGWQGISSASASLERAIEERDCTDPKMIKVVQLHNDALLLLISGGAKDRGQWRALISNLALAVQCLPRKGKPAEVIALRPAHRQAQQP